MKVLVVGGNGFLGKKLIESLVRMNVETASIVRSTSNAQVEGCHYVLVDQIINMRHRDLPKFDVIINIQGDEPLVDARQLDQLLAAFTDPNVQIATLASRAITMDEILNTNRIKVVVDKDNYAMYFSRSPLPNFANAKGDPQANYPFLRHIGLYAYRSTILSELTALEPTALEQTESLEQLRWLYHGYAIKVVETTIETPNIDVPEDVEKVLNLL
jgi:3-deoxy-manno-octulosonate cytidylyltransferase (CMP-KDO synthetase)